MNATTFPPRPLARGGGRAAIGGMGSSTSAIASWVKAHYKAVTVGGQSVYDLTPASS